MLPGRGSHDRRARRGRGSVGRGWNDGPAEFASLGEIAEAAADMLSPDARAFAEAFAGTGATQRANRAGFDRWGFRPRVLTGMGEPDTSAKFLGVPLSQPVLTAPFAAGVMYHPDGHLAVARANAEAGTASVVPQLSAFPLEQVAEVAPQGARLFQLYALGSEVGFVRLGRRAADAGYQALCVTVDYPTSGWRDRLREIRFSGDPQALLANYPGREAIEGHELLAALHGTAQRQWSWARLAGACAAVGLPFAVKGILTAEDARAAVTAGASAVVVSNHGGRQLDGAASALDQLPEVFDEVGGEVEIALDSGIRRGTDIAKAMALGADAVIVGTLTVLGLAAGGAAGVAAVLSLLKGELVTTLMLLGRPTLAALDRTALQPAPR